MAQPSRLKATVTVTVAWEPPVGDPGQPSPDFDHYRLYICNKPIKKKNDKVVCPGGELASQNVDKNQLEAEIAYAPPTPESTIYIRAVSRTRDNVESNLSNQAEYKPQPESLPVEPTQPAQKSRSLVSLANSHYMIRASKDFKQTHTVEHLWDRCMEQTPTCTSGSSQSNTVWIEFDFKSLYNLKSASLFGDAEGKWRTSSWSLSHRLEKNDPWQPIFTDVQAEVNDWVKQDLRNTPARYVRVEIAGDLNTTTVQARELEILGTKR